MAQSPYGYATGYIPNPPPKRRVPPPPPRRVVPPPPPPRDPRYGAPEPPNFQAFLAELAASMPNRSEEEMNALLDARVKPFTSAIDASTNAARAANEYRLETKAGVNEGLSSAFLKMLTGGKTGDEAMAYSKSEFGGSYLPAQVVSMAADQLRQLTSDFDDGDWKITGQYMEAMQQIPGIREEMRANIEKDDIADYDRRVQTAALLSDETWKFYNANRAEFEWETGRADTKAKTAADLKEEKRQFDAQMGLAAGELGIKGVNAATSAKSADIRAGELALREAKAAYGKAKDKVSQRQAQERINIAKGNLEVARQRAKRDSSKSSGAQKAEADLAIKVLTTEGDTIRDLALGTAKTSGLGAGKRTGGSYTAAYDYVYALAEAELGQYGRGKAYLNSWTRARLKSLGIGRQETKPRGG